MITEVKQYKSSLDGNFIFDTYEEAKEFENLYKNFYTLFDECYKVYKELDENDECDIAVIEAQQIELFNRAKMELEIWCDKCHLPKKTKDKLLAVENKSDYSYGTNGEYMVVEHFEGGQESEIIGEVFDILLDILDIIDDKKPF